MLIRLGTVADLEDVFRLNEQCFPEAWSKHGLGQAIEAGYGLLVCSDSDRLLGYILSQDIVDETHILQLAVEHEARRQGVGQALVLRLLELKREKAAVLLEVRASNLAAIRLYEKSGFSITGVRKNYYPAVREQERENAVQMRFDFGKGVS